VRRFLLWAILVSLPLAGLVLLVVVPRLDVQWENHPAHFWLVLLAAVLTSALALLTGETASRRGDSRVFRLSLVFLCASGFLALHALATPGVLLEESNAGFQLASAVGLLLASPLAAWSAVDLGERGATLIRRRWLLYAALGALMALWAAVSLASVAPLDDPLEDPQPLSLALFVAGAVIFAAAALGYVRLYRRRSRPLLAAAVSSFVLLAEAMLAVALARNWHATWWEWHLLMLVAFGVVAWTVWKEWQTEGSTAEIWSDLYEESTLGRREALSVLFADLQGFTSYAEERSEAEVRSMLDQCFASVTPALDAHGGVVVDTIGDAVLALFRGAGHEERAARAGLAFQHAAAPLADGHPDWPRFRVGVNSGEALVGVVQVRGARKFAPTGDTVNVGSRLEGQARAGEVVIGEATREALGPRAGVEDLGELPVKGKERPVRAFVLRAVAANGDERDQSLEDEQGEPEA
jgi:adenylate cyclase